LRDLYYKEHNVSSHLDCSSFAVISMILVYYTLTRSYLNKSCLVGEVLTSGVDYIIMQMYSILEKLTSLYHIELFLLDG
jgi:hypothetical protein